MGNNQNRESENEEDVLPADESERNPFADSELRMPELLNPSVILEENHVEQLYVLLPPRVVGHNWKRLFSTVDDGFNLRTLYRLNFCDTPVILVIKDIKGAIFGALLTEALRYSQCFYGGGESFLYTFYPKFKAFKWTGINNFFIKGNTDCFVIGAGGGGFGLWVDVDLDHGRSQKCLTFDNDVLSESDNFKIQSLEAWGFVQ